MTTKSKTYLTALIPLASIGFFNPFGIISGNLIKVIFALSCILACALLLFSKNPRIKNIPKFGYTLLYIGMLTGLLSTVYIHRQGLTSAIISILPIFLSYSAFFIFYKLNVPLSKFFNVIKTLCIIGICVYAINYVTFPNFIFGTKGGGLRAGMMRMWIPFIELQAFMFFYYINLISKGHINRRNIFWLITFGLITLMSITRQMIILCFGLGTLLYLYNTRGAKKYISAIIISAFIIVVVPNLPIYKALAQVTQEESERTRGMEDNIRVHAWNYYTKDAQESDLTKIIGNGIPVLELTKWGRFINSETNFEIGGKGYYPTDVGWAGFFFYFGFIGTSGLLIILLSAISRTYDTKSVWITAWFLYILITAFTSGVIIYFYQVTSISMVLYLVYGQNGYCHTRIQQR